MHLVNDEMKSCIVECLRCYQTCLSTVMGHCLEIGGQHTEPKHFTLMLASLSPRTPRAPHHLYGPSDRAESIATIHAALDADVTLLERRDGYRRLLTPRGWALLTTS